MCVYVYHGILYVMCVYIYIYIDMLHMLYSVIHHMQYIVRTSYIILHYRILYHEGAAEALKFCRAHVAPCWPNGNTETWPTEIRMQPLRAPLRFAGLVLSKPPLLIEQSSALPGLCEKNSGGLSL
jgi:hypothetical protein